ncbi:hypothetical protein IAT38_003895 [Cryptococcus sp. DSM 104549]
MSTAITPFTADEISQGVKSGNWTIRLTNRRSKDPQQIPTSFVCTADMLHNSALMSGKEWRHNCHPLRHDYDWLQDQVYDLEQHILGWQQRPRARRPSEWISATEDFEWAVWEISRRLVKVGVRHVDMSIIRSPDEYSRMYRGSMLVKVRPDVVVPLLEEQGTDDGGWEAANYARAAKEVLFYKRIFEKDILGTLQWTKQETPFPLPDYLMTPPSHWQAGETWTDRLLWDPRSKDSFSGVAPMIQYRREEIDRESDCGGYYYY